MLLAVPNYNTVELLSQLLFSLFRVVGRANLTGVDILVIDNASKDASPEVLRQFESAGMVRALYNTTQRLHGPALNQALAVAQREKYHYFWAMDSDVVVLRTRIVHHAIGFIKSRRAALIADIGPIPRPHASCLILDPVAARRTRAMFANIGQPAARLYGKLVEAGYRWLQFPFRSHYYIVHVCCGTRQVVQQIGDTDNPWYGEKMLGAWYHGDPLAPELHAQFREVYFNEVPSQDGLLEACQRSLVIRLKLPEKSPGRMLRGRFCASS
jgi:glycosyltransferase involved in cell wall biosynthesis